MAVFTKKWGTSAKFSPVSYRAGLEIPWLRVRISAGRALKERQCTLKGQAWYVNVWGSVHWECTGWGIETWDQVHKFPHMGKSNSNNFSPIVTTFGSVVTKVTNFKFASKK